MKKLIFFVSFSVASASVFGICDNFAGNTRSERSGLSGHNLRNIEQVRYVPDPGTGFSQFQEKDDPKDLSFTLSSLGTDNTQSQLSEQYSLQRQDSLIFSEQCSLLQQDSILSSEQHSLLQQDSILSCKSMFSDYFVGEETDPSQPAASTPTLKRKHYQSDDKFFRIKGKQPYNSDDEDYVPSDTTDLEQNQSHPPRKKLKPRSEKNLAVTMWKVPNLKMFSYNYDGVENVPSKVWNFKWLKSLNLRKIGVTKLPAELDNLANSRTRGVCFDSINQTTELPKEIGNLENLEKLDISDNAIEILPEDIAKLTKLRELTVAGNFFHGIWPSVIERLPNLKRLNLDKMQEILWEEDLRKLKKNKNLDVRSSY